MRIWGVTLAMVFCSLVTVNVHAESSWEKLIKEIDTPVVGKGPSEGGKKH